MNLLIFGCKDTTLHIAKSIAELNVDLNLITISPEIANNADVAGYLDLTKHKKRFKSIYTANQYNLKNKEDLNYFKSIKCDLGIAIGWQRLIPENILNLFEIGVFGMHGSSRDLPYGRGRSPLNWSIIEDRKIFYTNLFKYDVGVDDGPILDTVSFSINPSDTAETLHYKNTLSMINLLKKNWVKLTENDLKLKKQKEGKGSYYPKRSPDDGILDWREDIYSIDRMIRAVSKPFFGSFSYKKNLMLKIFRANIFQLDTEDHSFMAKKLGEVCDVFPNGKFLIRCNGGILIVHEYEYLGSEILPGDILNSPLDKIKKFPKNSEGYFDI